jgi:serine/threonine protein kinase
VIAPGQVLDKYELIERVGQGGMAVVYRGLDRSLKRTVAVKVLHKHLADSQEARDRFEREAHAVAKLRHENILEIFAFAGADSDDSYIVTEFIDGVTLKEFITDHPLTFPELGAMMVLQIGRALAHAHAAGILHRDVKPENVMIRSDGVIKLTDFGISQMVDLGRLTVTGQLLGSPAYMAPEHVEGQPLDFRTDVFACGIVLYQLTVGRLPFEGKNPHEILKRIAECKFPDPRTENPRIGNQLGKIILRCMARRPDDRYPRSASW